MAIETKTAIRRHVLFGAGYFLEGLAWAFLTATVVYFLLQKELGVTPSQTGDLILITGLPLMVFKVFIGIYVDRFALGHARGILLICALVMSSMIALTPTIATMWGFYAVAAWILVHNFFFALLDVTADALFVRISSSAEDSPLQGTMRALNIAGVLAGAPLMMKLREANVSWGVLCGFVAAGVLVAGVVAAWLAKKEDVPAATPTTTKKFREIWAEFKLLPTPWMAVAVALLSFVGASGLTGAIAGPWLRSLSGTFPISTMKLILSFAGIVGAVFGGKFVGRRLTHKQAVGFWAVAVGVTYIIIGMLQANWESPFYLAPILAMLGAVDAAYGAVLCAMFRRLSSRRFAATHFAAFMAFFNLSTDVAAKIGGILHDSWQISYPAIFIAAGLVQIIILLPLWKLKLLPEE